MSIRTIERINGFDVIFINMDHIPKQEAVNAYVRLPTSDKMSDKQLNYPTYQNGDVVGVDTLHCYNDGQTREQRHDDACRQIKSIIKAYRKQMRGSKRKKKSTKKQSA